MPRCIVVLIGGEESRAHDVAIALSRHVTGAWSLELTALIARAAAPHSVQLAIVALVLDGALTLGEGWALYREFTWAPWIVVLTTVGGFGGAAIYGVTRPKAAASATG